MQFFTHRPLRPLLLCLAFSLILGVSAAQPLLSYSAVINTGLSSPVDVVNAGDGTNRIFIVQRGGTIRVYNGTSFAFLGTFLTLSGNFTTGGERGLLSLAFHPDYENNGYFFVYYTNGAGGVNVDRFQVSAGDPNVANAASRTNIMSFTKPVVYGNHNGGKLNFGPDGNLYFALGDSGSSGDPGNLAQNGNSYWGKMMRINVNNFATAPYYTVPADNPYVSDPNVLDEIWALGLRNPWRWSFDRQTGDMWIADVGQNVLEEVNYRPAASTGGRNYGWRCYEGNSAYNTSGCQPQSNYEAAIFEYPHNNTTGGFSITGGYVYRGTEFNFLNNYYICADYVSGNTWLIWPNGTGGWNNAIQAGLPGNIVSFGESENGTLYALSLGGTLHKVNATNPIPVTLVKFSGLYVGGKTLLNWQTGFEQQANRFEVEYSADGGNWLPAGNPNTVMATNLTGGSSYQFAHSLALVQKTLYRLKMIDNNGLFSYSPTVTVTPKKNGGALVYPTVVENGVLQLALSQPFINLQLVDANGKQVHRANLMGQTGTVRLGLPALAPGMYLAVLRSADAVLVEKVVIK
jgi:glucose/arabinose dehydrogenase